MRSRLASALPVVAATLILAACADAPGPVGPPEPPRLSRADVQDRLPGWFAQSSPVALSHAGTVFADLDEANNRLHFGVEHAGAAAAVRNELARLGIPATAYLIEEVEPIHQVATLRDRWRPTVGGIQIHFSRYLCTLGFNADDGAERSFITNSHCTGRQGGVQGTVYYQPTSSVDATVIATEVEDPQYFKGGVCPKGRKCRYSDAARAQYSADVGSTRGAIARTSGPNNGSLEVTGLLAVTSQDNTTSAFAAGTEVNKVGRTTGWTRGEVTASCVHVNVSGTNITQLCQTIVEDPDGAVVVGGGDSGSGVFRVTAGDDVQLVGILWGGNSPGTLFVFSPLSQIQQELGALTATN